MYLETPLDRYEYTKMPIALFLADMIKYYKLMDKVLDGYVYMETVVPVDFVIIAYIVIVTNVVIIRPCGIFLIVIVANREEAATPLVPPLIT
jgi:hypothetical protein